MWYSYISVRDSKKYTDKRRRRGEQKIHGWERIKGFVYG